MMLRGATRSRIWVVLALSIGLALRLGYVLTLPDRALDADEVDYVESARSLVSGGGFDSTVYYHVPPVPPLLLAGVFSMAGVSYSAARLFQCALFLPAAWVAYLLGRELAGRLGGLLTLCLVSVYPYFVYFVGQVGTEAVALLAVPALLVAGIRAVERPGAGRVVLLGVIIAIASLTRASIVYFILAAPAAFLIATGWRNFQWVKASTLCFAGFLAVYLPWCGVNRYYFGQWIPTTTIGSGIMLYRTALRAAGHEDPEILSHLKKEIYPKYYYPPGAGHAERLAGDRRLITEGKELITAHLDGYVRIVWRNFKRFWQFHPDFGEPGNRRTLYKVVGLATYGALFPFFVVGAAALLRDARRYSVLYLFMGYFTLVHVVLFGKLRYRIPMDPLILAWAAAGILLAVRLWAPRFLARAERWTGVVTPSDQRRTV